MIIEVQRVGAYILLLMENHLTSGLRLYSEYGNIYLFREGHRLGLRGGSRDRYCYSIEVGDYGFIGEEQGTRGW